MNETMPTSLAAALADLQTQLPRIAKSQTATVPTKTGGSYRYTYADLAQISADVLPLLGKLGLSFTSKPTLNKRGEFVLKYKLRHVSGESDRGEYPLTKGAPQDVGGQITYARRYCLCAVTGIAPDDDDDAAVAQAAAGRRARKDASAEGGEPGITAVQQREMSDLFNQLGIAGKADRLAYVIDTIGDGHKVRSATELTLAEAAQVIERAKVSIAQAKAEAEAAGETA